MKNKQTPIARKFAGNRRFIDDLFSANNPYFDRYKAEIYPEELILKLKRTPSIIHTKLVFMTNVMIFPLK